jgi:hypothetical protein
VIRILVSEEAFAAIERTLKAGTRVLANTDGPKGSRSIWVTKAIADALYALRRPGESINDTILRVARLETET